MKAENLSEGAEDFTGNVWHLENSESVLVDAGTGDSWERIRELEDVGRVVITHSHYDHVDNLPKIVERFDCEVFAFNPENLPVEAAELEDSQEIELAGEDFQVIHTPGHRDDSVCLYSPEEKMLFTGDLIFPEGGFGRTDLEDGDRDTLIESIERIRELEAEEFYPGHDGAVTDEAERWIEKSLENAEKREPKY